MSSGRPIMLSTASSAAAGDDEYNDVKCRDCYGVVVAGVSLLLFFALAVTAGLVQACAVSGFAMVFFGVIGWLVPGDASTRWADATGARRADDDPAGAGSSAMRQAGCAIDVPPAFTYECGADAEGGGSKPGAATTLCAVCLEGVRCGEVVRRLPACGHLFHMECVDVWLRSHATCPLCRRDLLPRTCDVKTVTAGDVLPPV